MPDIYPAPVPPFPDEGDDTYPLLISAALDGANRNYRHDSAALLADGRVIVQYSSTSNTDIMQTYYPNWYDFGRAANELATTPYSISTHLGGTDHPYSTVFRKGGGLYMTIGYGRAGLSRVEMWSSPSGMGESAPGVPDWVLRSVVQTFAGYPGLNNRWWSIGGVSTENGAAFTGRPIVHGGRWVLPATVAQDDAAGVTYRAAIWTSEGGADGPWTRRHTSTSGENASGQGSYGGARQIVLHDDGLLYWSASGNLRGAYGAYSADGLSWTEFELGGHIAFADPLFSVGGVMYRLWSEGITLQTHYFTASSGDLTVDPPTSEYILLFNPATLGSHNHMLIAVEGPAGEWAIVYHGQILASLVGCIPVVPDPLHISFKNSYHEYQLDEEEQVSPVSAGAVTAQEFDNWKTIERWANDFMHAAGSREACRLLIPWKQASRSFPDDLPRATEMIFDNWKTIERWGHSVYTGECGCSCPEADRGPNRCDLYIPFKDLLRPFLTGITSEDLAMVAERSFDNYKHFENWANRYARRECGCTTIHSIHG